MEDNLILNIPFDEPEGSTIAYDYSKNRNDGNVVNSRFIPGRQGNCIEFTGEGYCDIEKNILNLSSNFTLMFWLKHWQLTDGVTGKRIGFNICWNALEGYKEAWVDIPLNSWGHIAIVKHDLKIYIYLDTHLLEVIELPSQPVGISVIQDIYSIDYGLGLLSEVKIFDKAFSQEDINNNANSLVQLSYILEGIDFKAWDIRVSDSNGLLDRPKLKPPLKIAWDNYHGEVIDLQAKRVEAREITLNCFMKAEGKIDFTTKLNSFLDVFSKDGTQRLMVNIHPTKPLVYEVYNESGISISKRWNDDLMVGTFSLRLKEPSPVKRVVRHQKINNTTKTLSIKITTNKVVAIYWGDGSKTEDVYGDNIVVTHDYVDDGIYYAIVAGVIEDIIDFETNGIIVWSKL